MNLSVPDERVAISRPSLDVIESAVRKSFTKDGNATILVVDPAKNLFIQNMGNHIEYNSFDDGPIYAYDGIDVETAVQLYLSYAKGEDGWRTAVAWKLYLDVVDGQYQEVKNHP